MILNDEWKVPITWVWSSLNDFAEVNPGIPLKEIPDELDVSFIPMSNLEENTGKIKFDMLKKYKEVKKGYTNFINEDIILAKITPCMENGKIAIVNNLKNEIGFGSTEFHVIRLPHEIDKKFYFYFLSQEWFRKLAATNFTGTVGQRRVPTDFIKQLLVPLAPFNEQVRIISKIEELFSRLGAGVRSLQAAQTQLEQYRQATLQQAYTGKLTKKWRQKNGQKIQSRDSLLRLILDDKWLSHYENVVWNDLPDCWIKVDLNDLSWDSQYGTSAKCRYENKGTPVLRIPNIVNGGIDLNDLKYIESEKEISFEPLSKNDFLIIRTNGSKNLIGAAALITDNFNSPHYFASYLIRFRLKDIGLIPKWINEIWKSIDIRKLILANASTSAGQYNINKTKLGSFKINIPSISEQEIIVNKLDEIHSLYKYIKYQIDKNIIISLSLKQSIFKSAFEGRLVPQDPNDEPASMLLEKIKVEKASGKPSRKGRKSRGQMRLVK